MVTQNRKIDLRNGIQLVKNLRQLEQTAGLSLQPPKPVNRVAEM